jgi:hypothetical protein
MPGKPRPHAFVSVSVRGELLVSQELPGCGVNDGRVMGELVSVDTADDHPLAKLICHAGLTVLHPRVVKSSA